MWHYHNFIVVFSAIIIIFDDDKCRKKGKKIIDVGVCFVNVFRTVDDDVVKNKNCIIEGLLLCVYDSMMFKKIIILFHEVVY